MTNKPILVLGGTGKTGSRVVRQLQELNIPTRVAARSGTPSFDWTDSDTWPPLLEGTEAVYAIDLVDAPGPAAAERMRTFAEAAARTGLRRLVLLSARVEEVGPQHHLAQVEDAVKNSGLEWTIVRPSWFAQDFSEMELFSAQIQTGELKMPTGYELEPFVDVEDIAAVAVAALTDDGHHGQTYDVTGSRALTFGEAAAEIAAALGREISYTPLPNDAFVDLLIGMGVPRDFAEYVTGILSRVAEGHTREPGDGVRRALGREARDFSEYVKTAAASGAWS